MRKNFSVLLSLWQELPKAASGQGACYLPRPGPQSAGKALFFWTFRKNYGVYVVIFDKKINVYVGCY